MKMRTVTVLIIAVLSISVLSGCVDNKSADKSKDVTPVVKTGINSTPGQESNVSGEKIKLNLSDKSTGTGASTGTDTGASTGAGTGSADWCIPGSKIIVNMPSGEKEFTVTGITTSPKYQGDVCRAELISENGKTEKYYSKDGKFEAMNSSASGPGDVYSEAGTSVNSSG